MGRTAEAIQALSFSFGLIVLVGCGSAPEASQDAQPDSSSEVDATSSSNSTESANAPKMRERAPSSTLWEYATFDESTGEMTVRFVGDALGNIETEQCVSEYELDVTEQSGIVDVRLYELHLLEPEPWSREVACGDVGNTLLLTTPIDPTLVGLTTKGGKSGLVSLQDVLIPSATATAGSAHETVATSRWPSSTMVGTIGSSDSMTRS